MGLGEALQIIRAERAIRKLRSVPTKVIIAEMDKQIGSVCAELRHQGYQRATQRLAREVEQNMQRMGLIAAQFKEDEEAARMTDAHFFCFKIPISNHESLAMMYGPEKPQKVSDGTPHLFHGFRIMASPYLPADIAVCGKQVFRMLADGVEELTPSKA